jgi:tRNA(His) 5'-end guanylyltransferase
MSKKYSEFDKRMKKYEYVTRTYLTTRTPAIIRIDGRAFHTLTRGFKRPFDEILAGAMQDTMKYLCENIQGCALGYTQSDEITLVLVDYKTLETSAWFDYNIQKCVSVSASMATLAFNKFFKERNESWWFGLTDKWVKSGMTKNTFIPDSDIELYSKHSLAISQKGAMFDARVFNIPKEEVCNNILWRQQDAIRNSIQMVGHANFSDKQMHGKNTSEIKEMLLSEKGIDWNDLPTKFQRGSCCIKTFDEQTGRSEWIIDNEIPIFKAKGRKYIEDLIYV